MMRNRSAIASTALFSLCLLQASAAIADSELTPRQPLPNVTVAAPTGEVQSTRLIVKFVDAARVRAELGSLDSRAGHDLSSVLQIADKARFAPLIQLPEERLTELQTRAATRSGRAQPDLAGMMVVDVVAEARVELGQRLAELPIVEFAYIQALGVRPPGDIAPTTPEHVVEQNYRGTDPGMNADYALSLGYTGAGIRLSDCEYAWVSSHEDLVDVGITDEPGQSIPGWVISLGFDEHGTSVLGEISSPDNGYGVSGMAPGADVYVYPEWSNEEGSRRVTSITNAIADSAAGDVVLLEMQDGNFAPAEADPAVWTAVKTGTDAGVVVVAAAGNGNQNLDGAFYDEYRARGDSGAIIVGAGSSNTQHDKLSFSTYGERVDVHGWGENVFSVGYGDFAEYGNDKNQRYTSVFSGTSSASPFVTSAALLVQEATVDTWGVRLSSTQIRDLLRETGTPQGTGGNIGPFVNAREALDTLLAPPALAVDGSCPGAIELTVTDVTPNSAIGLLWSETAGSEPLTAGPCQGAVVGLDSPKLLTRLSANANGDISFSGDLPAARCGVRLQAIDLTTCGTSSVITTPAD